MRHACKDDIHLSQALQEAQAKIVVARDEKQKDMYRILCISPFKKKFARKFNKENLPVVTIMVESSIAPIYRSIPYSSSANPCSRGS
jgi:hypothetical protein